MVHKIGDSSPWQGRRYFILIGSAFSVSRKMRVAVVHVQEIHDALLQYDLETIHIHYFFFAYYSEKAPGLSGYRHTNRCCTGCFIPTELMALSDSVYAFLCFYCFSG